MTPAAWSALAPLVALLSRMVDAASVTPDQTWRIRALERALSTQRIELLPLALGRTGRSPPDAVDSWRHDRAMVDELPEAAVWMVADAACALSEGADAEVLRAVEVVVDAAYEGTVPREGSRPGLRD